MKKLLLFTLGAIAISTVSHAQFSEFQREDSSQSFFTLSNNGNTLQLGGRTSGYYEYRDMKAGDVKLTHDAFAMKDGDFDIFGHTNQSFVYEFHVSFLDLVNAGATQNTAGPTSPGFKAAYVAYEGFKIHLKLGYDKVPYSLENITPEHLTPFWGHATLTGSDFYSRRDFGFTANTTLAQSHINLYAGAYSGLGDNFFQYGSDATGKLEYIGRVEYRLTGKMKRRLVDEDRSSKPQLQIGLNARYENKTAPALKDTVPSTPTISDDPYGLRIINGKRSIVGGDLLFLYKGFSLAFEAHMIKINPADTNCWLYGGTTSNINHGVVNAGGYVATGFYNFAKIRSVVSVAYESENANDLFPGHQEWLRLGYAYRVNGFNSCAKLEYDIPTLEDVNQNPLKYTGQLRIGYQIVF